jgi:hypothetical protein
MAISNALRRVYVSNPSDATYLETIEVSHAAWGRSYAFVASPTGFQGGTSHGVVTYDPLPFVVTLPKSSNEGVTTLSVTIVNVGLELMQHLELAATRPHDPVRLTARVYVDSDTTAPASDEIVMDCMVTADDKSVTLNAAPVDLLNTVWPRSRYQQSNFPGLNR